MLRCKDELTYIAELLSNFCVQLPSAVQSAVKDKAQIALSNIEADLTKPLAAPK